MSEVDEELPTGPPRRIPAMAWWFVVAVVVGVVAGYVVGDRHGRSAATSTAAASTPASPSLSSEPPVPGTLLVASAQRCTVQSGNHLQLGVELLNLGAATITLGTVKPIFPLSGLRTVATWRGTCGQFQGQPVDDFVLTPRSSTWVTTEVEVDVGCPAALPVQFEVGYTAGGGDRSTELNAFSDLGDVPYTGCHPHPR